MNNYLGKLYHRFTESASSKVKGLTNILRTDKTLEFPINRDCSADANTFAYAGTSIVIVMLAWALYDLYTQGTTEQKYLATTMLAAPAITVGLLIKNR